MALNDHQRLFLAGVVGSVRLHLITVRTLLALAEAEGEPPLRLTAGRLRLDIAASLAQFQDGLRALLADWELEDRYQPDLPPLVQAQRLRAGLNALRPLDAVEPAPEERHLRQELATLTIEARNLEEAVINGQWGRNGHKV